MMVKQNEQVSESNAYYQANYLLNIGFIYISLKCANNILFQLE